MPRLLALLLAAAVLAACDEQEQDRILFYEKGTYLGKPDSALSEETLKDLRQRAARQGDG